MLKLHDYVIYADLVFLEHQYRGIFRVMTRDEDGYLISSSVTQFDNYKKALKHVKALLQNRDLRRVSKYHYSHKYTDLNLV